MERKKKLPIGIQAFSEIRDSQQNYVYIDKTSMCHHLLTEGKYYFLSRPRRFGKSLFLDTLAEILNGNQALFEGLNIYDKWDWSQKFPLIRFDFSIGKYSTKALTLESLNNLLDKNAELLQIDGLTKSTENLGIRFAELIEAAFKKYGHKVAVLVDEYDKPILDNLGAGKELIAKENRDILKNLFAVLKPSDPYLRLVFLTGVSKFSKLNLFSGANNIQDITLHKDFTVVTGYTHNDIKTEFSEFLHDTDLDELKTWYNGYNYLGEPVYNPYDILLFFSEGNNFESFWWQTGNPSFLIEQLKKKPESIPQLENNWVTTNQLNAFDIEHIDLRALLWQTGYLTFADKKRVAGKNRYQLKVPNLQVQDALNTLFLDYLTGYNTVNEQVRFSAVDALLAGDMEEFQKQLYALFASIPYQNYVKNNVREFEGYYASVIYAYLASLGLQLIPEDTTNKGRIDLTLIGEEQVFIFEFKVDATKEKALKQIKEKKYYEKYLAQNKTIYIIGIQFDSQEKNMTNFEFEVV